MLGRRESTSMIICSHLLLYMMELHWVSAVTSAKSPVSYFCSISGGIKMSFQTLSSVILHLETSSSSIACYGSCSKDLKLIGSSWELAIWRDLDWGAWSSIMQTSLVFILSPFLVLCFNGSIYSLSDFNFRFLVFLTFSVLFSVPNCVALFST